MLWQHFSFENKTKKCESDSEGDDILKISKNSVFTILHKNVGVRNLFSQYHVCSQWNDIIRGPVWNFLTAVKRIFLAACESEQNISSTFYTGIDSAACLRDLRCARRRKNEEQQNIIRNSYFLNTTNHSGVTSTLPVISQTTGKAERGKHWPQPSRCTPDRYVLCCYQQPSM